MENYRQMWMSLRNGLSMRIREYRQADNIAGLDDYGLTELDAWEGIMQEIEGLERQLEENNKSKENELINDMAETKRKAQAFDEIVKVLASISKEIVEYPGDDDKQKEVIYKRWDELFEPMKILEVDHEG